MSLTQAIHERLISDGLMRRASSPAARGYGATVGELPLVKIDPPAAATAVLRVRCHGASGDALLACAVCGALKAERPGCYVILETGRPEVAHQNPFVDATVPIRQPLSPRERLIDLIDLRPEADWQPRKHRLQQFADAAGVGLDSLRFFIHMERIQDSAFGIQSTRAEPNSRPGAESVNPECRIPNPIVLHPGPTDSPEWKGRNWLPERWEDVAQRLAAAGETVVIVGKEIGGARGSGLGTREDRIKEALAPSPQPPAPRLIDLRGQTTVYQLAHLIGQAKLFVGIESLPAIIAQSLGVPAVLFFGSIAPELRVFRDNVIPVTAPAMSCLGCHHDEPLPTITYRCRVGGEPCQSRLTVERMLEAIRSADTLTRAARATKIVLPGPAIKQPPPIKLTPHSALRTPHSDSLRIPYCPIVLLRRESSDGDVLVASSVAAAVKKRFPSCRIVFETLCPALLKGHPYIDEIVAPGWQGHRDMLADMNVACENLPYSNMLAVYASRAAVSPEECEFFVHTEPIAGLPDEYAVMHVGPPGGGKRRWVGRAWLDDRFLAVAGHLAERGLATVLVGSQGSEAGGQRPGLRRGAEEPTRRENPDPRPLTSAPFFDLRGKTTLYQLAYVIAQAKLFVGIDSLPFHIAQALNVPGVAFFGSIRPELRIYRANMKGVCASELSCIGCHHDRRTVFPEPPETAICRIGHEHCRTAVTVRRFVESVEETLSTLGGT